LIGLRPAISFRSLRSETTMKVACRCRLPEVYALNGSTARVPAGMCSVLVRPCVASIVSASP
jgi:hypothetical protein